MADTLNRRNFTREEKRRIDPFYLCIILCWRNGTQPKTYTRTICLNLFSHERERKNQTTYLSLQHTSQCKKSLLNEIHLKIKYTTSKKKLKRELHLKINFLYSTTTTTGAGFCCNAFLRCAICICKPFQPPTLNSFFTAFFSLPLL